MVILLLGQGGPVLLCCPVHLHAPDLVSIVEGLDNFGQTNSGPGFFSSLQRQMDPEMLHRVLGSPFVQTTLSTSSPQLTRQLILSNPQIHQLVQTNPEVGDMLNNADVITQVGIKTSKATWCKYITQNINVLNIFF